MRENLKEKLRQRFPAIFNSRCELHRGCEISCGDGWYNLLYDLCTHCEWCGDSGTLRSNDTGWIATLCDKCREREETGYRPW
jgi:hypothetical protein